MRDHWEFYPCHMGENIAFIFYDHDIRETIGSFGQNQQIKFDLTYKSPNDKGLPNRIRKRTLIGWRARVLP